MQAHGSLWGTKQSSYTVDIYFILHMLMEADADPRKNIYEEHFLPRVIPCHISHIKCCFWLNRLRGSGYHVYIHN